MKKGMCQGCDNLTKTKQRVYYRKDGFTRFDPPKEVMKPFCSAYGIHIEYVSRILETRDCCPRYLNGGMS